MSSDFEVYIFMWVKQTLAESPNVSSDVWFTGQHNGYVVIQMLLPLKSKNVFMAFDQEEQNVLNIIP